MAARIVDLVQNLSAIGYSFPGLPCRARWSFRVSLTSTPRRRAWMRASITLSWFAWFRKGADQGNAQAQYNLGAMYAKGQGVPQDFVQAFDWFGKAADQGNAGAQATLGWMYANGQGVAQDDTQALMWSILALARAEDDATRDLAANIRDALAAKMTPDQIAEAQRMAVIGLAAVVAALTGTPDDLGGSLKATHGEGRLLDRKTSGLTLEAEVSHLTGLLEAQASLSGDIDGHPLEGSAHVARRADGGWALDNLGLSLASAQARMRVSITASRRRESGSISPHATSSASHGLAAARLTAARIRPRFLLRLRLPRAFTCLRRQAAGPQPRRHVPPENRGCDRGRRTAARAGPAPPPPPGPQRGGPRPKTS